MSKNQILTSEEYDRYRIKGPYLAILERYARENGFSPQQVNVLDWGCGRGRFVLRLRELGYNAYGVDLDPLPMQNARELYAARGHCASSGEGLPLHLLRARPQGGWVTDFSDGFFHCIFSGQVLEHVSDLRAVAQEMARLTCPGGIGYHNYPARRHMREAHLYMPFVHWLPKNDLRRRLILLYLRLGFQPGWEEVRLKPLAEQAAIYAAYSIEKTFYRSAHEVCAAFQDSGFQAEFDSLSMPRLDAVRPLLRRGILRAVTNALMTTFVLAELYLKKPG